MADQDCYCRTAGEEPIGRKSLGDDYKAGLAGKIPQKGKLW